MYNATIPLTALGRNSVLTPTAANFPALKMFASSPDWIIGDNTITDPISGVVLDASQNVAAGSNSFNKDFASNAGAYGLAFNSGTFPITGIDSMILWFIGDFHATAVLGWGENYSPQNGIMLSGGVGGCYVNDGGGKIALTDLAYSGICLRGMGINAAAGALTTGFSFEYNVASGFNYQGVATALAGIPTMAGMPDETGIGNGHSGFYNFGVLEFSGALPPTDFIKAAMAWQFEQAILDNHVIYPGLKNVA